MEHDGDEDDLLSPDSSISFDLSNPAVAHQRGFRHGSHASGRSHADRPHGSPSRLMPQEGIYRSSSPGRLSAAAHSRPAVQQAPLSAARSLQYPDDEGDLQHEPREEGGKPQRRNLADLERLLANAMSKMEIDADPRAPRRGGDDGPFDISELWAAGSQQSASQSEQSYQYGRWSCKLDCCTA